MTVQTSAPFDGLAMSATQEPPAVPEEASRLASADHIPAQAVTQTTAPDVAAADSASEASGGDAASAAAIAEGSSSEEGTEDEGGGEEEAAADGDASKPGDPAKKKRRRKRKKKPNGEAAGAPRAHARPASERSPFHAGEEVFGRVTAVLEGAIMVDLAGKALAIFDRSEMEPDDLVPAVGDRFVASVLRDGSRGGLVVLSRKPLREEAAKALVLEMSQSGTLVKGLVTGVIKGGVEVSIQGLRAFAPASGMDLHPQNANFTSLLGQVMDFKVTQCDEKARDVVVTRRPMLEAEAHERRKMALQHLARSGAQGHRAHRGGVGCLHRARRRRRPRGTGAHL